MEPRLKDAVALITGSGSGIGLATARRFAAEGATVVAGILSDDERHAVAEFDCQMFDVREEDGWDRVLRHIAAAYGGLSILVNSAGVHRVGNAEATTREIWDAVMEVNVYGTFLGCKKVIPIMRQKGQGNVVSLSSREFEASRGRWLMPPRKAQSSA